MADFEKLQNLDRFDVQRIHQAIEGAVRDSYYVDANRNPAVLKNGRIITHNTASENKRRVDMCLDIFKSCYCEKEWGLSRSLGELSNLLRKRLDGENWAGIIDQDRMIWVPGDGN